VSKEDKGMKSILKIFYEILFYKLIFGLFKLFPVDSNKIIYISHYGSRFGCNPKSIYDYIKKNYNRYKHVIVLNDSSKLVSDDNTATVPFRSISFLKELATSKYWVSNTNLPPNLKPSSKTVYLQTWHAAGAFKKFGLDLPEFRNKEKESWQKDTSHWTYLLSSAESVRDIYASACGINKSRIYPLGLPRNDIFFNDQYMNSYKKQFREKYAIPESKKIILYAPTYRDVASKNQINLDFQVLEENLSEEYVFLLKLHPLVAKEAKGLKDSSFVKNFSEYSDIQDLLLVTDVLITDYSSVIFDFALTGNPIIFYSYDLEEYDKTMRGFYFPYKEWVPGPIVYNQAQLMETLKTHDRLYSDYHDKVLAFAKEYNAGMSGDATEKTVKLLLETKQ